MFCAAVCLIFAAKTHRMRRQAYAWRCISFPRAFSGRFFVGRCVGRREGLGTAAQSALFFSRAETARAGRTEGERKTGVRTAEGERRGVRALYFVSQEIKCWQSFFERRMSASE